MSSCRCIKQEDGGGGSTAHGRYNLCEDGWIALFCAALHHSACIYLTTPAD